MLKMFLFFSNSNSIRQNYKFLEINVILLELNRVTVKKSYRCPKCDSYAMQTLEIRVEQKGIFDETDNEFSKTRQIEASFPKTKREKKKSRKDLLIT